MTEPPRKEANASARGLSATVLAVALAAGACRGNPQHVGSPAPRSTSTAQMCSVAGVVEVVQEGPGVYSISPRELERVIEAVREYARSGRKPGHLVPYVTASGPVGIRLATVGPNARCGLELGDTVLTLDGIRVDDAASINRHAATLSSRSQVTLEVDRRGRIVELRYNVKQQ